MHEPINRNQTLHFIRRVALVAFDLARHRRLLAVTAGSDLPRRLEVDSAEISVTVEDPGSAGDQRFGASLGCLVSGCESLGDCGENVACLPIRFQYYINNIFLLGGCGGGGGCISPRQAVVEVKNSPATAPSDVSLGCSPSVVSSKISTPEV